MDVLITGADGFVGKEIVRELLNQKINVVQVRGPKSKVFTNEINNRDVFSVDITKQEELKNLWDLKDIEIVVHSAGLAHQFGNTTRDTFQEVNVLGTKNVVELALKLKVKHFILISSVSVYGKNKSKIPVDEETICNPKAFYAESKYEAEKETVRICRKQNINLTILRLATVVGEEDKGNFLRLIKAIKKGRFLWIGNGENKKSIIYKKDVAKACFSVLQNNRGFEVFNVSSKPIKVKKIIKLISEGVGRKPFKMYVPPKYLKLLLKYGLVIFKLKKINNLLETIEKWLAEDIYSAEKIKKVYGFEPDLTAEEALMREVEWFKKQKC